MEKRALYNWLPVLGWMGVIFYFSSQPAAILPTGIPDYVPHFFEYSILSWLLVRALGGHIHSASTTSVGAAVFTVLYGISDEIHQLFVPTRTFSVKDMLVDSLAAFLIATLFYLVNSRR